MSESDSVSDSATPPATGGLRRRLPGGAVAGLAALTWVVLVLVSPGILGPYYVGLAVTVGITALLALGLVLVTGLAGQFSLAQAAFFGVGAYGSGLLTVRLGWPPILALVVSAGVAVAIAYLLGRPIFRLRGHFLAMGTLALAEIFYLLVGTLEVTGSSSGFGGVAPFSVFGFELAGLDAQQWVIWFLVGAGLWAALRIRDGRDGRALRAIRSHEIAAATCGVNVSWSKTRVFAGSAFLGSLAGSFYAHQILYVNPAPFSPLASIDVLAVAVLGGLASPWGAVIGAVGYEVIQQGVSRVLPEIFGVASVGAGETLVVGAVLVLVLIIRSDGLVGIASALWRTLRTRARGRTPARSGEPVSPEPPTQPAEAEPPVPGQSGASEPALPGSGARGQRTRVQDTVVLSAEGLSKSFGGVHAVSEVDLVLYEHEILAVIGPNGAGKSTLLNLLSGVLTPSSGRMQLSGDDISGQPPHRVARARLARTFQTPSLFSGMDVRQNVLVGAHTAGRVGLVRSALPTPGAVREERRLEQRAQAALARVGVSELAERPAAELSLGQQKLVEVARALAAEPRVLLMDEPGAGLNRAEKLALAETIRRVREDGVSVLLIEHDMEFVMSLADRVHVLDFGRTLRSGTPGEVQEDPEVIRAYLGIPHELPAGAAEDQAVVEHVHA